MPALKLFKYISYLWKQRTTDIPEIEAPDDEHDDTPFTETWKYMERLVDEGYTKSIGISNFNSQQIDELLDVADIKPVLNQVCLRTNYKNISKKEFLK